MRRFEWIQKNQAKFWEIERYDDLLIVRTGAVGTKGKEKDSEFPDDMAAEVEFDKLIHTKRRQGWVEVEEPSQPPEPFEERAVELRPLDGSPAVVFSGPAMQYLLWRMVEIDLFDRHRAPDDLSRWEYRACRQLKLESNPEPGDKNYEAWKARTIELSARDRAAKMKDDLVGAFKYRSGSHWIMSPAECAFIGPQSAHRRPKRKKETEEHREWLSQWCAFHDRVQSVGYEIVPV